MANNTLAHLPRIYKDAYLESIQENQSIREDSNIVGGMMIEAAITGTQAASLEDQDSAKVINDTSELNTKRTYDADDLTADANVTNYTASDVTEHVILNHTHYITAKNELNKAMLASKGGSGESLVMRAASTLASSAIKKSDRLLEFNFPLGKGQSRFTQTTASTSGDLVVNATEPTANDYGAGNVGRNQKRVYAVSPNAASGATRTKSVEFDRPNVMARGIHANIKGDTTGNRMVDTATQNLNWFQILDAQKVLDNIPNNEYDMGNIVVLCTVDNGHSLNSTTQYAIHRDFRTGDGLNTAMKFSANKANMINGISVVPLRNVTFPVFNATPKVMEEGSSNTTAKDYNTTIVTYSKNLCPVTLADTTMGGDSLMPNVTYKSEDNVLISRIDSFRGIGLVDARYMVAIFHK